MEGVFSGIPGLTLPLSRHRSAPVRGLCVTLKAESNGIFKQNRVKGRCRQGRCKRSERISRVQFSVVTEYSTRDKEGNPVMDIVWFNVAAWEGREQIGDVFQIQKGMWIEVTGRVRIRRYMTQENEERTVMDVVARKIKVLQREDDQMQPQRDY